MTGTRTGESWSGATRKHKAGTTGRAGTIGTTGTIGAACLNWGSEKTSCRLNKGATTELTATGGIDNGGTNNKKEIV